VSDVAPLTAWTVSEFTVGMPHLLPGQLSETELNKVLGGYLWDDIAAHIGRPPSAIVNDFDERLYASFLCFELSLGNRSLAVLGEDTRLMVNHRVDLYAGKFAEGFAVFNDRPVDDERLVAVRTRADLDAIATPWAYAVNGFVTRAASNTRLKLFSPAGISPTTPEPGQMPQGLSDHEAVFASGQLRDLADGYRPIALEAKRDEPIVYEISPESDLNGAGLLYFARYVAIMNYAERTFLRRYLARPFSNHLIRCLSTDHRRTYYFANADDTDSVEIHVAAHILPAGHFPPGPSLGPLHRVPFKMQFRLDLYRVSDGVLMATSLVRKSLTIPSHQKPLLTEAKRAAAAWERG
jgi:probable biosynthetic protein (TIGR04098 family)